MAKKTPHEDRSNKHSNEKTCLFDSHKFYGKPATQDCGFWIRVHFESYVWFKFVLSLVNPQAHDSKSALKSTTYYRDVKTFAVTNTVLSTHLGLKLSRKLNEM